MTIFAAVIMMFTFGRQRRVRRANIVNIQMAYAEMTASYIRQHNLFPDNLERLSEIADILPQEINLSIWTANGEMLYDSEVDVHKTKLRCNDLPEIKEAAKKGKGASIRTSNFLNEKFVYCALRQTGFIVRTAIPYAGKIKTMLKPDIYYTGMMVLIFSLFTLIFSFYHFRFRAATKNLKFLLSTYVKKKKFPENVKFTDIELNEIKDMFIKICNKLEDNEKSMSQMTNNIAHELRTPVTSIRGLLETLLDYRDISVEKKYEYIERAYNQTMRLSEVMQDVILLSRTAEAPDTFTLEQVNIYDLIIEILEDADEIIKQRNATIELNVEESVVITGSRTLLYSIFRNLLSNALKYAGENVTVSISKYKEDEQYYYFTFYDNGNGVDEKYIGHIFDRFYRLNDGRTRDKGGSGLGLAIVRDAIKFHHGKIKAANRPEGGLAFLFTLRKMLTDSITPCDAIS
jgi:signal transduction histidine kinase